MKIIMLACIYKNLKDKEPIGFRMMDMDTRQIMDVNYQSLYQVVAGKKAEIVNVEVSGNKLRGSNGAFDRYTKIINGQVSGGSKVVILTDAGEAGFEVANHLGKSHVYSIDDTVSLAEKHGIANGKVVLKDNKKKFISAISGTYPKHEPRKREQVSKLNAVAQQKTSKPAQQAQPTQQAQASKVAQPVQSAQTKQAAVKNKPAAKPTPTQNDTQLAKIDTSASDDYLDRVKQQQLPVIRGVEVPLDQTRAKEKCKTGDMAVDQKFTAALLTIKAVRTFCYAVLQTIKRKESIELPTMAVSLDSLYYNTDFVSELMLSEVIFVLLHEVYHIAMKHNYRRGVRDPKMWNIACDLYINKVLCEEFSIDPDSDTPTMIKLDSTSSYQIKFPGGKHKGLYNSKVDTKNETPEMIYSILEKESETSSQSVSLNQNQGQNQGQQGQGQGQGQQGQDQGQQGQQGQGQGQGQGQQGQQGQGQPGQGQTGQGQPGQGQPGQGQGQGQQGQQGQGQGQPGQGQTGQGQPGQGQPGQGQGQPGQGQGQSGNNSGGQSQSQSNQGQTQGQDLKLNTTTFKYKGDTVTTSSEFDQKSLQDIINDEKSRTASDTVKNGLYDSIMKKAKVLEKQVQQGRGKGDVGVVEAYVDQELIPKVNWRTILLNRLVALKSDEKSLSTPDRRFVYSGTYIEGPREEEEQLKDIKITVDTSGSMTDEDIAIAFGQISQLLKTYKVDAELIFWDDGIQSICKFDDFKTLQLAKLRATGRGGTDPNCVFELFEKDKEYRLGLRAKPALIIMFTDGYFSGPNEKYKAKYGRDTVWVISGDNVNSEKSRFEPPFGKVAKLKL